MTLFQEYLRDLPRLPFPTHDEEIHLARLVQQGLAEQENAKKTRTCPNDTLVREGEEATEKLFFSYTRLVISIAKQHQGRGVDIMDLIQAGNIGLWTSIPKYDPERDLRFSTYATWWIRQAIYRSFPQGQNIILPQHKFDEVQRVKKRRDELQQENIIPGSEDIASSLGLSPQCIEEDLIFLKGELSLYKVIGEGNDREEFILADTLVDPSIDLDDTTTQLTLTEAIKKAVNSLNESYRTVIQQRFGLSNQPKLTLEEIAKKRHISKERVRQIQKAALEALARSPELKQVFSDCFRQ